MFNSKKIGNFLSFVKRNRELNTLKDLSGNYVAVAGENSNAEILFHVEGLKKTIPSPSLQLSY